QVNTGLVGPSLYFGFNVALQPGDSFVVVGVSPGPNGGFGTNQYHGDGSPDLAFGTSGMVVTTLIGPLAETAADVALEPDGKIVVAGSTTSNQRDFALARYNRDGSLDASFGSGGKVTTDFGGSIDKAEAVAVQSTGKIVVLGDTFQGTNLVSFLV